MSIFKTERTEQTDSMWMGDRNAKKEEIEYLTKFIEQMQTLLKSTEFIKQGQTLLKSMEDRMATLEEQVVNIEKYLQG